MKARFREMARGAALATDTQVEVVFSGGATTMKTNRTIADRWVANARDLGIEDQGHDASYGSTDMGNVSWVVPSIHPELAIAPEGTPAHSLQFRDAAATPQADETTLLAATLVAQTAWDLLADAELVEAARREFRGEP